ncbi:MAG: hypothetical protein CL610_02950 [Anaerolineaceae bacterium]|nr:hypothetical protein [Anaerolineaceae bacterium]
MTDQTLSADTHDTKSANQSIFWVAAAALLISFGATMFLFSAAYAKDVETLLKAPELVWAFICGQPSEYGVTLPLLLTAGTMAVLGGVVTTGVTWWRHRN